MVAYSFQPEFVDPIRAGAKCQTIRADRKRHARAGEQLQLYRGMRTRGCFLIGRAVCLAAVPISIDLKQGRIETECGTALTAPDELNAFAARDGFTTWRALLDFWQRHHPGAAQWSGVVIRWHNFEAGDA